MLTVRGLENFYTRMELLYFTSALVNKIFVTFGFYGNCNRFYNDGQFTKHIPIEGRLVFQQNTNTIYLSERQKVASNKIKRIKLTF